MSVIVIREPGTKVRFDSSTDTWTVTAPDGRTDTARTVIDARRSDEPTVAVHGMPNFFRVPGPDVERQMRFVQRCLDMFERSGATRIEAKSRILLRRFGRSPLGDRFYLTSLPPTEDDPDLYDGPATLTLDDREIDVRVRLAGNVAAIDGHYHWRGIVRGDLPADVLKGRRTAQLSVAGKSVAAKFAEQTPWGSYTISGVGAPPYA